MGGCDAINNVPRPNPKDPAINLCTVSAVTREEALEESVNSSILNAQHYCNDRGKNPKLVAGFSDFAGLAQQDPAIYGTLLYKEILASLDRNINPLDEARGFIGTFSEKAIIELASSGTVGLIKYGSLVALAGLLNAAAKKLGTLFFKFVAKLCASDSAIVRALGLVGRVIGAAGEITVTVVRLVAAFERSPVKFIVKLTLGLAKAIYRGVISAGKYAIGKIFPSTGSTVPNEVEMEDFAAIGEGEAEGAGADAVGSIIPGFVTEFLNSLGASVAATGVLDYIPGLNVLSIIGQILYAAIEGFLDLAGATTIKFEEAYCNNIGDRFEGDVNGDTEWTVFDNNFDRECHFNDVNRGYRVNSSTACCYGKCAIVGYGLRCVRQNFRADPFVCCMNDHACNGEDNPNTCFQTPDRQRTCHPLFRDLSSNFCRDIIFDYCSGDELLPTQNDWLEMWLEDSFVEINSKMIVSNLQTTSSIYNNSEDINLRGLKYPLKQKQPCLRAIARAVSTSKVCSFEDLQKFDLVEGTINSEGFVWSKNLLEKVFKRYTDEGGSFLGGINTDGINRDSSFYNTMWKICNQIPGLCTNILNDMCDNYTAKDLVANPFLLPWCSCYLPEEQYQKYEVFGINKECTPLCNRTGVIPAVTGTGQRNICQQTVCMIDNTTIDLINTDFDGGSININQICASCGRSNVKANYNYGNITENITVDGSYFINPPDQNSDGNYTSVYGSGFDLTKSNQQESLIIPKTEYDNGNYQNNLKNYYSCILGYGKNVGNGNIGVVSIIVIDNTDGNPAPLDETTTYVFGVDTSGKKLFDTKKGSPAETTIIKASVKGSTIVSHNSTTYGQEGYSASINTCSCITSGISLKVADSRISGSINLVQECGNSQCFDDQNRSIPCTSTGENPDPIKTIEEIEEEIIEDLTRDRFQLMFFSALGLFVIIVIFFMFRFFYKSCYRIIYTLLDKYVSSDVPN